MILVRIYEIRIPGTHHESLVLSESFQWPRQFLLRHLGGNVGHKYRSVITTLPSPCGLRRCISVPDCLSLISIRPIPRFIFVYFRNTMISRLRKRRGFSAYACKVHLTECTSAKTTSARLPSCCTNTRVTSPKHWKMDSERTSALMVFGGRPVSVMVVVEEDRWEGW